jgi:hypothetical protein
VRRRRNSGDRGRVRQARQRRLQVGLGELGVLELAGQVGVVGGEVEVAVAAQAEEDDPLLAGLARRVGLLDRRRIAWAGSGAGMIPSERANCRAAANVSFWR